MASFSHSRKPPENPGRFNFRVIPLRLDGVDVSFLSVGLTWLDVARSGLSPETAFDVLLSLYPGKHTDPKGARDIYISASWRVEDSASAHAICRFLGDEVGFRLIGDAKDQQGFARGDRVERIVQSTGGLVAIIPYRGEVPATPDGGPYKYFLREIAYAKAAGIPTIIVADARIQANGEYEKEWLRLEPDAIMPSPAIKERLQALWSEWADPPRPMEVFLAFDHTSEWRPHLRRIRNLVERVTGMATHVGFDERSRQTSSAIIDRLRKSFLVVADLTGKTDAVVNVDVCIEAGAALAAGTNLRLLWHGERRRPPFMLGDHQVDFYANVVDLIGLLHNLVRPFRRRVISRELV